MAYEHGSSSSNTNIVNDGVRDRDRNRDRFKRVGRYELGPTLGTGNTSVVRLARNLDTGENVAIKVFDKQNFVHERKAVRNRKRDLIQREISILKMIRHPNVVRLIEVMATTTNIYIVMELLTGGELWTQINQTRLPGTSGMKEPKARKYFQQLICALDYCHSRGITHRDLKPEKLLLSSDGVLKVSDFGLSALSQQSRKRGLLRSLWGTPQYTAPEVMQNRGYEVEKIDIWSCGVILFFTVAGYTPFANAAHDLRLLNIRMIMEDFKCPFFFSRKLETLIKRLLDPNPITRITINEIFEDEWFKMNFEPPRFSQENISFDDDSQNLVAEGGEAGPSAGPSASAPVAMNAFEMLCTYLGFNLIGNLFNQVRVKRETIFISQSPANEILAGIEYVAGTLGFSVDKRNYRMRIFRAGRVCYLSIATEIYEMAPDIHMVELRKAEGDTSEFYKFYTDLCTGLHDIIWKAEPIDAETDGASTSTAR